MAIKLQGGNIPRLAATPSELCPAALVFDFGVDGLSVHGEIRHLLPDLHYIYAFDSAAFPYGERNEVSIVERVVEIVTAVQERYPLTPVVVVYNTAGTASLPASHEKFDFPVIDVVPATKPAVCPTANGIVESLAARGTVRRSCTHELIACSANECQIEMLGSAEVIELAEAKLHGEDASLDAPKRTLRPWLRMKKPPDTTVLGHIYFSLLQEELLQVLPEETWLVGSDTATARQMAWLLGHKAPDVKPTDTSVTFYMAMTSEAKQLLPILQCYGFETLERLAVLD